MHGQTNIKNRRGLYLNVCGHFQVRDGYLEIGVEREKKYSETPVLILSILPETVNGNHSNISLEQVCSNVSNRGWVGKGGGTLRDVIKVGSEKKIQYSYVMQHRVNITMYAS